ncbi:MAG: Crp/Fnr family transcriptional regulator [Deltaproteobacteria bacterium]|nr:Crp/Fnr family transcriptional regulator [Deltaproteobacteria bacterium]
MVTRGPKLIAQLAACPLFAELSSSELASVAALGEARTYRAGEHVLVQGQDARNIYVLLDGFVRIFMTDHNGTSVTVRLFRPPAVFAEVEALTRTKHIEYAEVMRKALLLVFETEPFERIMDRHPSVARALLLDVCVRFRSTALGEARAVMERVEQRLGALLLSYARVVGVRVADGIQLGTKITQDALADEVGISRKSVSRILQRWIADGFIVRRGSQYVITNVKGIVDIASTEWSGIDHDLGARPAGDDFGLTKASRPTRANPPIERKKNALGSGKILTLEA